VFRPVGLLDAAPPVSPCGQHRVVSGFSRNQRAPVILPVLLHWLKTHGRPLARAGCVAIGTVYVLVGTFALFALSGRFIENADEDRIVAVLLGVPGGWILIWGIVLGAAGYLVWRLIEVLADPYEFGSDAKGLAIRGGVALSAIGFGLIALSAARIAMRGVRAVGSDASEQEQQYLVAQVLQWPAGQFLVGLVGAIVLIVGLMQFGLVVRRAYTTEVRMKPLSATAQRVIHVLAWYGYAARGVILCVLGYFLVKGAVTHDPSAVDDTDTAFDFIGGGLIGDTAFAIVAIGTVAYGIFMYANAWHYRFEAHPDEAPVPGSTPTP
jgi:hypothetical protein